jgi:hypothetical protein
MISLKWSWQRGEGSIKPKSEFLQLDHITKLDSLTDWIHDLQKLYDETLLTAFTRRPDPETKNEVRNP